MSPAVTPNEFTELLDRLRKGQRRALARLITHVENGPLVESVRQSLPTHRPDRSRIVGLTGSPGAGKSSLTASLVHHLRELDLTVAVLASDPASPFTGGALLGDRVRMDYDPGDEGVFIRSFSSRGATGGLSESTADVLRLVEEFGFDVILIETVGSGQDQLAVRDLVDVLVLVLTPAGGDDVQWEKAGQMEAADVIALNKADLPGTDFALAGLRAFFELSPQSAPPIVRTVATKNEGIGELWQSVETVLREGSHHPRFGASRRLLSAAQRELRRIFEEALQSKDGVDDLISQLTADPSAEDRLARELLRKLSKNV